MIPEFEKWRTELLFTANIIQDTDLNVTVPEGEAVRRSIRYAELLEMVKGDEGQPVCETVIESVQAKEDYGAYQTTFNTLEKFPGDVYAKSLIRTISDLIERNEDFAAEFLMQLARKGHYDRTSYNDYFNEGLLNLDDVSREKIIKFIRFQEEPDGWLEEYADEFASSITPFQRKQLEITFNDLIKKHSITNGDSIAFTTRIPLIKELLEEAESINTNQFVAFWQDYLEARESI